MDQAMSDVLCVSLVAVVLYWCLSKVTDWLYSDVDCPRCKS